MHQFLLYEGATCFILWQRALGVSLSVCEFPIWTSTDSIFTNTHKCRRREVGIGVHWKRREGYVYRPLPGFYSYDAAASLGLSAISIQQTSNLWYTLRVCDTLP